MGLKTIFRFTICLVALVAFGCDLAGRETSVDERQLGATAWQYTDRGASVRSNETVSGEVDEWGFTTATMGIDREANTLNVWFRFPGVNCAFRTCTLVLELDNQEPTQFTVEGSSGGFLYLGLGSNSLVQKILDAKVMRVEIPIRDREDQIWTFDVAGLDEAQIR